MAGLLFSRYTNLFVYKAQEENLGAVVRKTPLRLDFRRFADQSFGCFAAGGVEAVSGLPRVWEIVFYGRGSCAYGLQLPLIECRKGG